MKTFNLKNNILEFDDKVNYYDFYLDNGKPILVEVFFEKILTILQEDPSKFKGIKNDIRMLSRWVTEVPRKRFFRNQKKEGITVISTEIFFETFPEDEAEKIFTALENTGYVASKICDIFNVDPVVIKNSDPFRPVPTAEALGLIG